MLWAWGRGSGKRIYLLFKSRNAYIFAYEEMEVQKSGIFRAADISEIFRTLTFYISYSNTFHCFTLVRRKPLANRVLYGLWSIRTFLASMFLWLGTKMHRHCAQYPAESNFLNICVVYDFLNTCPEKNLNIVAQQLNKGSRNRWRMKWIFTNICPQIIILEMVQACSRARIIIWLAPSDTRFSKVLEWCSFNNENVLVII